jgi:hypothetical protein
MTVIELEQRALALQTSLHNARDALQRALDQAEECPVTERGAHYATSMISQADDFCHTALRQVNEIAAALSAAAIERSRVLIV